MMSPQRSPASPAPTAAAFRTRKNQHIPAPPSAKAPRAHPHTRPQQAVRHHGHYQTSSGGQHSYVALPPQPSLQQPQQQQQQQQVYSQSAMLFEVIRQSLVSGQMTPSPEQAAEICDTLLKHGASPDMISEIALILQQRVLQVNVPTVSNMPSVQSSVTASGSLVDAVGGSAESFAGAEQNVARPVSRDPRLNAASGKGVSPPHRSRPSSGNRRPTVFDRKLPKQDIDRMLRDALAGKDRTWTTFPNARYSNQIVQSFKIE
ncbi:hypothetical protein BDZ88DRAFT_328093 [Geranomyces variabilis]|nr:hypothetical protein BDZ88DRAFT_328093 [Geranomyces variabilis]KAJ3139849.1 hypothetical protein HDU90_008747 [Geranomyces variabilis]